MAKKGSMLKLVTIGLVGAALYKEFKKPADEREWHGEVAGFVPYDFRIPTAEKLKARLWDPEGPLVSPQVFGVGWSVNFGKVADMLERAKQPASTS